MQRRSVRVPAPPVQVRIAGTIGRLINVSATGALVQVERTLEAGRAWPMLINVEPEPVELHVRVIRSRAVSIELPDAIWQRQEFAVALAFTALPANSKDVLRDLCGDAYDRQE